MILTSQYHKGHQYITKHPRWHLNFFHRRREKRELRNRKGRNHSLRGMMAVTLVVQGFRLTGPIMTHTHRDIWAS